jgi:TolA-binding protein
VGIPHRWPALVVALASMSGVAMALAPSGHGAGKPGSAPGTATVVASTAPVPSGTAEQATKDVVDAAGRLGVAVERAREESTKAVASSLAALKRFRTEISAQRADLARQQADLASKAEQLSTRAAELTKEGDALQREAAALRSAEARFAAQPSAQVDQRQSEGGDD